METTRNPTEAKQAWTLEYKKNHYNESSKTYYETCVSSNKTYVFEGRILQIMREAL